MSWQKKWALAFLVSLLVAGLWWLLTQLGMPDELSPKALADWTDRGGYGGALLLVLLMVLAVLFWGILVTRLVPVFSFALVSYTAGLTAVTLGRFLLASIIGMLPMTLVFVGLGQGFQIHPLASVTAAALLLTAMTLAPYYLRNPLKRYLASRK